MKKKLVGVLLTAAMAVSALAGCGSKQAAAPAESKAAEEKTETVQEATEEAEAAEGEEVLTVWCWDPNFNVYAVSYTHLDVYKRQIVTFKTAVRSIAKRFGLYATFMPKPKAGTAGSGMHINISLFQNGKNIFSDPEAEDGLSQEAKWFMGGIMAVSYTHLSWKRNYRSFVGTAAQSERISCNHAEAGSLYQCGSRYDESDPARRGICNR